MEGFKKLPKQIACFKEGGSVQKEVHNFTKRDRKNVEPGDLAQDKKLIKKAFKQHDEAEHDKEPTEIKLKKGGRAKKETGTVKKFCGGGNAYKEGGSVTNVYEAKKKSGDISNIAKVKDIKPGKAAAPSKASVKPNFEGSDVEKETSKPAGHKDPYIKSKQSGKAAAAPSGAKGPDAFKKGGKVKKYAVGGNVLQDLMQAKEIARLANARKYLGKGQQGEFAASEMQQTPAMTGMGQQPSTPAPSTMPQTDQVGNPTGAPMKKGGKVKGKC